jgi:hypothetical protein
LKLLAKMIGLEETLSGWLAEARDHWTTAGDWGVGCIDAKLDEFLIDQGRIDVVAVLSERSLRFLEVQGPVLTCEFLNDLCAADSGSQFTRALDAEIFARVGRAFIGLIREQFEADAATVQWF